MESAKYGIDKVHFIGRAAAVPNLSIIIRSDISTEFSMFDSYFELKRNFNSCSLSGPVLYCVRSILNVP